MRRALLSLLIGAALLAGIPAEAFWQSRDSNYNTSITTASYVGPGNIVSGATFWFGLRAYNAAYAATPGLAVNVRRSSDSVACDVNVAASGALGLTTATCNSSTQGGITPAAFAGNVGTASCTIASTTATCTGASATPTVGDPISGAGLSQPCVVTAVGTFTAGSGTLTAKLAEDTQSCGTVSVAETLTFQVPLFVTEWYDQTGNGHNVTEATTADQPQLLLTCAGASHTLPCLGFNGTTDLMSGSLASGVTQPDTIVGVGLRPASATPGFTGFIGAPSNDQWMGFHNNSNLWSAESNGGANGISAAAADGTFHAGQAIFNGGSNASTLVIDGTATAGSMGAAAFISGTFYIGSLNTVNLSQGYFNETGLWPAVFNSTQYGSMHTNMSGYWGTP